MTAGPAGPVPAGRPAVLGWVSWADLCLAFRDLAREVEQLRRHRAWWARRDPVAYVWLCRAERRGAVVPWSAPGSSGRPR
jgi:hypothetical protein